MSDADHVDEPVPPPRRSHTPAADGSDDPMRPPKEPCECWCMHCRRTFMSDQMWFQRIIGDPSGFPGQWLCPTPNCGGAGFTFDIFPTDPDHPANEGWHWSDDEDDEDETYDEEEWDEDTEESGSEETAGIESHAEARPADWDPNETKYKQLDEALGDDADDDIEGEEWKYGLQPGERPPEPDWMEAARREREEEERQYDMPDSRPREVQWTEPEDRRSQPGGGGEGETFREDDIPF